MSQTRAKSAPQSMFGQPIRRFHTNAASGRQIREWYSASAPSWRLLNAPAKEGLDLIEDESVDCVVTSPPYFWLRDYKVDGQIGLEESVDGYVAAIKEVME